MCQNKYILKGINGDYKKDEVIVKRKSFGSNCVYPSIFKDYFLEAINESGYQNRVVYKDLDNLSLNLKDIKVNMYSVNIFLTNIFKHYKKVRFNVLQVKKIYHVKESQLYNAKISISYKGSMWLMELNVGNTLSLFPVFKKKRYTLPILKKAIDIYMYSKEEQITDLYYRIINNLNANAIDLYNLYLLYYSKINESDLGIALENLFLSLNECIDCTDINKKINLLTFNKKLRDKWVIFKYMNNNISVDYEDIMSLLYLILLKLKERIKA